MKNKHLEELIYRAELLKQDVKDEFSNLTEFQLNWKPAPDAWSIAQCLDHLIVSDEAYFEQIEKILEGRYRRPFWSLIPGKAKFWGRLLISLLKSDSSKKLTAPAVFEPSESKLSADIVDRFLQHEEKAAEYLRKLDEVKNDKFYIQSPVSPYITYKLPDLEEIMLLHHERHFKQAKRITESDKFPKSDKLSQAEGE
jgi:hypothetical protein